MHILCTCARINRMVIARLVGEPSSFLHGRHFGRCVAAAETLTYRSIHLAHYSTQQQCLLCSSCVVPHP